MLELEMALDTDLGIDSIKRVEILSALQDKLPAAPAIKPEHLGTLQTVGQIVDFLASVSGVVEPSREPESRFELPSVGKGIDRKVLRALPLHKDDVRLSLKLPQGAMIWVSDDGSSLSDAICEQLAGHGLVAEKVAFDRLDALVPAENLAGLIILAPSAGTDDRFLLNAFRLVQLAEPVLNANGSRAGAILAVVSRLNGFFGLTEGGPIGDVMSGGLAGLAKTAGHEWPDVSCRAFDLANDLADEAENAKLLVAELLYDGPQEIGVTGDGLYTLDLVEQGLPDSIVDMPVNYGDVVIISGGARGVTAEAAVALAASS